VAGSCEYIDEPSSSGTTELVSWLVGKDVVGRQQWVDNTSSRLYFTKLTASDNKHQKYIIFRGRWCFNLEVDMKVYYNLFLDTYLIT
jgi:hypothetical protein